jgi:hypothetical protein
VSVDLGDVRDLHDAAFQHVRETGHANIILDDDPGRKMVGLSCVECPVEEARWYAPHPGGLLSMCAPRIKDLWGIYRTLAARREIVARGVQDALKERSGPRRSAWRWLREPGV